MHHQPGFLFLIIIIIVIIIVVFAVFSATSNDNCNNNAFLPPRKTKFDTVLNGNHEVPPVKTRGTGKGDFILKTSGDSGSIKYKIVFKGLSSELADFPGHAHFHLGKRGTNGPVVKTLNEATHKHGVCKIKGVWKSDDPKEPLTSSLIRQLESGNLYINIHSKKYPSGEIRGQVTK